MPLLDHFRAPLAPRLHGESFNVHWAGAIADALNERVLPEGYFAEEQIHRGARVEIDVATFEETPARNGGTKTAVPRLWSPPSPSMVIPGAYPDRFSVLIFESEGGARLVAAVELVSPANKDRDSHRRAFAIKCGSYLCQRISLILIDIVTTRQANLHNEIMRLLGHGDDFALPTDGSLYAVGYRPATRDGAEQIDAWPAALALGEPLPTLPLPLNAELALPLDLEATYTAACQRRRLP